MMITLDPVYRLADVRAIPYTGSMTLATARKEIDSALKYRAYVAIVDGDGHIIEEYRQEG